MKNLWRFGALALCFVVSSKGYSWGNEGHSIVALVAQQELAAQSKNGDAQATQALKAIQTILGDTTIDSAATWPDEVKQQSRECTHPPYVNDPTYKGKDKSTDPKVRDAISSAICDAYRFTASWHFINTDQTEYSPAVVDFKGDIYSLINGLSHTLKGEPADVFTKVTSYNGWKSNCLNKVDHNCKKEALSFLIHFVGDIHQPLHVGGLCDVGGNSQFIRFFGKADDPKAFWCKPAVEPCIKAELHQTWDATILLYGTPDGTFSNSGYATKLVSTMADKKQSADKCVSLAPDTMVAVDEPNGPVQWANESICYMQQVYTFPDPQSPVAKSKAKKSSRGVAEANHVPNQCTQPKDGTGFAAFDIGQKYVDINSVTINERLFWAGNRLASLLKNIYGHGDQLPGELSDEDTIASNAPKTMRGARAKKPKVDVTKIVPPGDDSIIDPDYHGQ